MQITINLASRPYLDIGPVIQRLRFILATLGGLALAAGVMAGIAHFRQTTYEEKARSLDRTISADTTQLTIFRNVVQKPENIQLSNRTTALNQLFDEKAFSWTLLMRHLEGMIPQDVQLSSIQPVREKDGSISLHMHVLGPRGHIIECLENLEHSSNFIQPRVLGETSQDSSKGNNARPPALSDTSAEDFEVLTGYVLSDSDVNPPQGVAAAGSRKDEGKGCSSCPPVQVSATSSSGPAQLSTRNASGAMR